jgi:Dolichyl-phosphate-mannose--protein O-mannosyl transferase
MSSDPVRYDMRIRLRHCDTNMLLKSLPKNYVHTTSSFQQIVGADAVENTDATWLVKGPDGTDAAYKKGDPVKHGDTIRLEHVTTHKNLHSHSKSSPLTNQQEVSAFSPTNDGVGDGNDNWTVDMSGPGEWLLTTPVRLDFRGTGYVLHSHKGYADPRFTAGLQEVTAHPKGDSNDLWAAELVAPGAARSKWKVEVFISHSSRDEDLAAALVELLRCALKLKKSQIRCSSVNGYKFPFGAAIDERIKEEVNHSRVFIALVTPSSMKSAYVLFEMGARWGRAQFLGPLIARGAKKKFLSTPVAGLHALLATDAEQLQQFVDDLALQLGVTANRSNPAKAALAKVASLAAPKLKRRVKR